MEGYYKSKEHEERMLDLMHADGTERWDMERISLFYIIAGVEGLYSKRHFIYDFKEHGIKHCLEEGAVDFSSGLHALLKLGFNLYNGYQSGSMDPLDLFWHLDSGNRKIAQAAIQLRFD